MDDERKFSKDQITTNVSTWVPITGKFKAEHYPGTPLLDTSKIQQKSEKAKKEKSLSLKSLRFSF